MKSGSTIWALPTMLKAFTTLLSGAQDCTSSPPDEVCPTASSTLWRYHNIK
jgi:hypothetical protein